MSKDTISIHLVREALLQCGPTSDKLLKEAGIDDVMLKDDQARVPAHAYARLWRKLSRQKDDEFFGMDLRPLKSGSFAFLCHVAITQPTVGEALQAGVRFLSLMLSDFNVQLTRERTVAEVLLLEREAKPKRAFTYFTYWMIVHGVLCWVAGRRVPILAVEVRGSQPAYIADYQVMFSRNMRFDCTHARLIFAAKFLDLPVRRNHGELQRFLARAPANILVRYRDPTSLSQRIRQHLRDLPPTGWPQIEYLAAGLNASVSTLRRRLASEGQSYQALKDTVRKELAIVWLAEATVSLEDIAERLGFADASSFYKAFRKWTGVSPGHYRSLILKL